MNAKEIRLMIGIIGNVTSILISLLQMFISIYKKKSLEGYQPHRNVGMLLKCGLWVLYGLPLISNDIILVTTSNGVAFVIEFIGLVVFYIYTDYSEYWKSVVNGFLILEAAPMIFIYTYTLWLVPNLSTRHAIVGVSCNVSTILVYFFLIPQTMLDNKSFKYMPFWLSFISFINAGIWTAYSLIYIMDIHLLISYALGMSLCALQMLVHACYYYHTTRARRMNENDAT